MKSVLSAILLVEAIVIGLAIPVALAVSEVSGAAAGIGGGVLAVACLLAAFLVRRRGGVYVGSALQVAVFALGFVVPVMFVLGVVFGALWAGCLIADRRLAALARASEGTAGG